MKSKKPRTPLLHLTQTQIVDVWAHNLEAEMREIWDLIDEFNVIALDTEFPGVSYDLPEQDDKDYEYAQLIKNVKKFKLIQLGISLANEEGEVPLPKNTWQFHFKFDLRYEENQNRKDHIVDNVRNMLESAGINFDDLNSNGIDQDLFADHITGSGLILNDDIKYIVFHGAFDFGYLIHLFHHSGISENAEDFTKLMNYYFPKVYDLKYLLRENSKYKDIGLSKLAYKIDVNRIGPEHQAGSDALLTLQCYQQMKRSPEFQMENFDKHANVIYGIGKGYIPNLRRKNQSSLPAQQTEVNMQMVQQQPLYEQYYDQTQQYDAIYPYTFFNMQQYSMQNMPTYTMETDYQKRKQQY